MTRRLDAGPSTSPNASRGPAAVALAVGVTTLGPLPIFMTTAMATPIREDLPIGGAAALGAAVTLAFVASALSSVRAGQVVQRLGSADGVLLTALCSVVAMVGLAGFAGTWVGVAACLMIAGVGNSFAQVTGNHTLARLIGAERMGVALGTKQAAVPAATMLAGLAVPVIALTIGWRWVYGAGILLAVGVVAVSRTIALNDDLWPKRPVESRTVVTPDLVAITLCGAFGGAAAASLSTFFVESGIASGVEAGTAGVLFAAGSAAGLMARIGFGAVADRQTLEPLAGVAVLMGLGMLGLNGLSVASQTVVLGLAAVAGCATGWGWNGLLALAVVRRDPGTAAAATGMTQTGVYAGGALGPTIFGFAVERWSYVAAWRAASAFLGLGACCAVAALVARHSRREGAS